MPDLNDPNVKAAVIGRRVELFLEDDVGAYLVEKAKQESERAYEEFKKVDPMDAKAVWAVQRKAVIADKVLGWLGDAIAEGYSATEQLKEGV